MKANHSPVAILSLGTALEWAEYTFYGYMAFTLSSLFFPQDIPHIGILKTFGVFAVGYIMRPLGAVLFGYIGDRIGRKQALMASICLMGISTFGIGSLPTYTTLGPLSAWLLLAFRLLQGLSVAGEYSGAWIYSIESAKKRPALAGSWISASAAAGMVIGGIAAFCISLPNVPSSAWRIPFLLGGISCFAGLWFRKNMPDSSPIPAKKVAPLWEVLKFHKRGFLNVCAIAAFTGVFVYIGNIYIVVFLKTIAGLPTHHATLFAIFGELIVMIFIPIMGLVCDKTGIYKQYRVGLILIALSTPFVFMLCSSGQYSLILIAMIIYGLLNGIVCGPMAKILFDQFPYHIRYTGISFAWSLSAAIFSGTAPGCAQFLMNYFNWNLAPSFYVSFIALLTYAVLSYKPRISQIQVDKLNTLDLPY